MGSEGFSFVWCPFFVCRLRFAGGSFAQGWRLEGGAVFQMVRGSAGAGPGGRLKPPNPGYGICAPSGAVFVLPSRTASGVIFLL